jgi:hypothetical protein
MTETGPIPLPAERTDGLLPFRVTFPEAYRPGLMRHPTWAKADGRGWVVIWAHGLLHAREVALRLFRRHYLTLCPANDPFMAERYPLGQIGEFCWDDELPEEERTDA